MQTGHPCGDLRGDEPPSSRHWAVPLWRVLGRVDHGSGWGADEAGEMLVDRRKQVYWSSPLGGNIVKGPMYRAMADPNRGSHMPLQVDTCYKGMMAALKLAVETTVRRHEAVDVDPESERDAISKSYHWSSHLLRRRAGTRSLATRNTQRMLVPAGMAHSKELIDYFFGWKLRDMQKDMQLHYSGMDRGGRLELARVTAI